jgi:hypothetical protein
MMMKEEAARRIEGHLEILVDYGLLDDGVAVVLGEYIWKIIGEIDTVIDVASIEMWRQLNDIENNEKKKDNDEPV